MSEKRFNIKMAIHTEENGSVCMDETIAFLLREVSETQSLAGAVKKTGHSYSHCYMRMKEAERMLGRKLLVGSKGRGSRITSYGQRLLERYERLCDSTARILKSWSEEGL